MKHATMHRSIHATMAVLAALLCSTGCSGGSSADAASDAGTSCTSDADQAAVISQLSFIQERPPTGSGISEGFNLDGRVSVNDPQTCNQNDFTSPDGTPGIDNQLSILVTAINTATNSVLDATIHNAINNGQLLLSVDIRHLDNPVNDPCVDLVFTKVTGMPLVGTDMNLNPGQTFDVAPMTPMSTVHGAVVNGTFEAGPFELVLPITILDAAFMLNIHNAHVRVHLNEDGSMTGLIGGALAVADVGMIAAGLNIDMMTMSTVTSMAQSIADLDQSGGDCHQFSAAISFVAVRAFINP